MNLRDFTAILCIATLLTPVVYARTKQGDKYLKLGQKAETENHWDAALDYYDKAVETDPNEAEYTIADQRARTHVSQEHLIAARKLREQQKLTEALVEFQKAYLADPSSQIALQEIQQTDQMVKEKGKLPAGTAVLTPAQQARAELEKRVNALESAPALRPINNQISSLKMNNQPIRVLYESVCKLAGINVLFDPQGLEGPGGGGGRNNFNIEFNNVTPEQALNYIALETHTFWKPVSRNAIFVTQESDTKRQEYQDEVVKVFYVQNAATPAEFTEIYNAIRTGAKLTTGGLQQLPSQSALVVRGSPDTVALIEKLVHDLDRPKAEVVVDLIFMEVSKDKNTTLGAAIAGLTNGLNVPIQYTPRNPSNLSSSSTGSTSSSTSSSTSTSTTTTTGATGTTGASTSSTNYSTIASLHHISSADFSVSLPGGLIQALLSENGTRVLYRPQVRATDGGKAILKIGSRVPYVSGSLNSAVATAGSVPYATTQFQEVDVGVNIELAPHVNGPDDVSMHLKMEVSNVTQTETIAGVQEPIIGQKVSEADIRMKDGEVSLLSGLTQSSDTFTVNGIPGVTNIPLLGYLFGSKYKDHATDNILVAMVPHIVRSPDYSTMAQEGILGGTEHVVRVERVADQNPNSSVTASPASTSPGTGAVPVAPGNPLNPATPRTQIPFTPNGAPLMRRPQPNQQSPQEAPPTNPETPATSPPEQ